MCYIYIFAVNMKWNADIDRYRKIPFQWPNRNGCRNGIHNFAKDFSYFLFYFIFFRRHYTTRLLTSKPNRIGFFKTFLKVHFVLILFSSKSQETKTPHFVLFFFFSKSQASLFFMCSTNSVFSYNLPSTSCCPFFFFFT